MFYFFKIIISYFLFFIGKLIRKQSVISAGDIKNKNLNIAILCSAGIGDALMVTPLIAKLYEINQKLIIDVIIQERLKDIFSNNKNIREIIIFKKKGFINLIGIYKRILNNKYDIIFGSQPSNTLIDAFLSSASKINIKLDKINKSYLENRINKIYTHIIPNSFDKHRVELNLDMLRVFGIEIEPWKSNIYFGDNEIPINLILTKYIKENFDEKYLCVHPGSAGEYKRWDIRNFVKLIDVLKDNNKILLIGGRGENDLSKYFENKKNVYDLIGKINLVETYSILKHSKLFLCNDSGMMHLACAANANIIALFGSTNPKHIGPYSSKAIVIKKDNINDISVENVLDKINSIN